jgi:hypothetical protein
MEKKIAFTVSEDLYDVLRKMAVVKDRTVNQFVKETIRKLFDKQYQEEEKLMKEMIAEMIKEELI